MTLSALSLAQEQELSVTSTHLQRTLTALSPGCNPVHSFAAGWGEHPAPPLPAPAALGAACAGSRQRTGLASRAVPSCGNSQETVSEVHGLGTSTHLNLRYTFH